MTEDSVRLNS